MRPVTRGSWPEDHVGNRINFQEYARARRYLIERMGSYCSFCGMRLDAGLAVEHVLPKNPPSGLKPDRIGDWENFLLACVNCNSNKGSGDINLEDFFWPHLDNTMRAIQYQEGGMLRPHPDLTGENLARAQRTVMLTGLDKIPSIEELRASDRRWQSRRLAWEKAVQLRKDLDRKDSDMTRRHIVDVATATGYWPVWFTVFVEDVDMLRRLRAGFPGTAVDCFDENMNLICRPAGRC
jgi:hypothetical protein